jgi:hypothetical protein
LTATAILSCILASTFLSHAQTILSGNISGTWSPSGNPYIISDNANVPSSQTLTIQPGVVVWIGEGLSINVFGNIQAIGTASQRITIQAPISSQYWSQIYLNNNNANANGNPSVTNSFQCCDFSNATNAIWMDGDGGLNAAEFLDCTFSNCLSSAIYGGSEGIVYSTNSLTPVIENCIFSGTSNGCVLNSDSAYAVISANIFTDLSGTAVLVEHGTYATAIIINNVIVNCTGGVNAGGTGNAQIQSCIFKACTNAVAVSGSNSRTVSYNDFFGNTTNFIGYPSTYGTPIILNRNGTSCDLLYNIFQNPQFISTTNFQLQTTSPCVDAGEGSPANFDCCFPPSLGTVTNDIGAYGGPNAGQWILPVYTNFFTLSAASYVGVTINPPSAGHYELEYTSALAGIGNWIQLTNMDLSAPFTYTEPVASPARFYRAVKLY